MRMFWKEFRECSRTLPLAMIVFALVWWMQLPTRGEHGSSFDLQSGYTAALLGCVYALLLGVLQVWPLQRTEVRGWLLSQPVSGRRLFWTMTMAAASIYFIAMLLPFLGTLWVLHTYLPVMAPIDPRSFYAAAMAYLFAFVMHAGTVWMLSRPARWVGSKTFVLALPIGVFLLAMSMIIGSLSGRWLAFLMLLSVAGASWVFMIARDAFVVASKMPSSWNQTSPPSRWSRRLAALGMLTVVAILVWTGSVVMSGFLTSKLRPRVASGEPQETLRFDADGRAMRAPKTNA